MLISLFTLFGRKFDAQMTIFLQEPRYQFGCLGFYTEQLWGRRILFAGVAITLVGLFSAIAAGMLVDGGHPGESIFLIASAWIIVFGFMRLFWTGAMWVFSQIFDWVSESIPSLSSAMHFLKRAYWVFIEAFLSLAFLVMLVTAIFVAFGVFSMAKNDQAEQGAAYQPLPALEFAE